MTWLLVPLAYVAMVCQDVLGSVLVMAEADRRAHTAALCDTVQDAARLTGLLVVAGTALDSRDLPLKIAVIAATLAADYSGTYLGVRLGGRLIKAKGAA
jgi:hypothetical protein